MPYSVPIYVDPATLGQSSSDFLPFPSRVDGPYLFGGNLYLVLCPGSVSPGIPGPVFFLDVWKSTDGGATWATVDHAGAIQTRGFQCCFDGAKITCVTFIPSVVPATPADFNVIEFDLATELWGVLGAAGPEQVYTAPMVILPRSTGSKIILFSSQLPSPTIGNLEAVEWNGGVYGAVFRIDISAQAAMVGFGNWQAISACVDAADRVHVFFNELDGALTAHLFYQQITAVNTMGTFFEFALGAINLAKQGNPCVVGVNVFFPIIDLVTGLSAFVGTPLAAPVFTEFPALDGALAAYSACVPDAVLLAGSVFLIYTLPAVSSISGIVRILTTADFVTWVFAAASVLDLDVNPIGFVGNVLVAPHAVAQGYLIEAVDPAGNQFQSLFSKLSGTPLAIADTPPKGQVNTPYAHPFPASGGTPPYAYSVSAGSLPPGLSLNPLTGNVSGTPTTPGIFCFTITVTDSALATASVSACITIFASVIIQLIGWKLYPDAPCADTVPGVELPPVDRAI
jgi:hypothetical protein